MSTKEALSLAMNLAAGHTYRVRQLKDLARGMLSEVFERVALQHPSTLERDLEWAHQEFVRVKEAYEAHCKEIGEPAYCTYNED